MKILYATSEAAPFAASGGLGDVLGALPKTLCALDPQNNDVSVILPLYSKISHENRKKMKFLTSYTIAYGWRQSYCGIYEIDYEGVKYFFIDNEQYFKRDTFYGQYDDAERFAFFSLAVCEFMLHMNQVPDILHANDWQTAMTVVYLKTKYHNTPEFQHVKTVFSIHNIEYQGKFDPYILGDVFALDNEYLPLMTFDNCLNLLKAAIVSTDHLSTVSQSYANELKYSYFAFGLEKIIEENSYKMSGVINGIDTIYFSPDKGGDIVSSYTSETFRVGKRLNKLALQKELGLDENPDVPMISMITRLTATKGLDLVVRIFEDLMGQNVQFVLLGTGESTYENLFRSMEMRYPNRVKCLITFDRILSKKIYASSDIFLMPSKSEPCGLSQMIACSYGTIPIVRSVGGLKDSIKQYGHPFANGFLFDDFNAHQMLDTILKALQVYENKEDWNSLVYSAMKTDFTWKKSALLYEQIYQSLLQE